MIRRRPSEIIIGNKTLEELIEEHRRWLLGIYDDGKATNQLDLTGADLSNADLTYQNLSNALMNSVDFSGSNLSSANFFLLK